MVTYGSVKLRLESLEGFGGRLESHPRRELFYLFDELSLQSCDICAVTTSTWENSMTVHAQEDCQYRGWYLAAPYPCCRGYELQYPGPGADPWIPDKRRSSLDRISQSLHIPNRVAIGIIVEKNRRNHTLHKFLPTRRRVACSQGPGGEKQEEKKKK